MNWMKYENNQSIKTVKEHLNNTAENLFYGTHLFSLPADVLWGSFVTHSFLPHGRLLNTADIYVHQSQAVYGFL